MSSESATPDLRGPASPPLPFAPATDLPTLTAQLGASLPGGAATGLDSWRRYHDAIVGAVVIAVAGGELDAPAGQHGRMAAFLPYIQDHLGAEGEAGAAAQALVALTEHLELQAHALAIPRLERELTNPTALQRAVLGVLLDASQAVHATEVHEALPTPAPSRRGRGRPANPDGWTRSAASHALEQLVSHGLVVRSFHRVNGKRVAHYRLWGAGRELCARLGIEGSGKVAAVGALAGAGVELTVIRQLEDFALDDAAPLEQREAAVRLMGNRLKESVARGSSAPRPDREESGVGAG